METNIPYIVYVLWSNQAQRFYIGITENIEVRLKQHNNGSSKWTSRYAGTWELCWSETCSNLTQARKLENFLKRQKNGNGFYKYTGLQRAGS